MPSRRGLTIVELLVVVTIIGVLVALLLPAVQSAREAARRAQCQSQLRQLALAALTHHDRIGHFPTGGWSERWMGDADRGFGEQQPGGWAFNVLPFLEESALHDLASDGQPWVITATQLDGAGKLAGTAVPILYCPSRRPANPYPHGILGIVPSEVKNARLPELVGKLDYIINGGDFGGGTGNGAPSSLGDARWFSWCHDILGNYLVGNPGCDDVEPRTRYPSRGPIFRHGPAFSGVSFRRSEVEDRHVTDGTSRTYLIGEKNLPSDLEREDYQADLTAWTGDGDTVTAKDSHIPARDRAKSPSYGFGSSHPSGCQISFCDGSVRLITYDIDYVIHMAGLHRGDGTVP